ncbi:porin [Burkholderia seminalis]|uniref:Porin n=1 Tax=Burkholderia cenocepacia TaxID=95486 RepID=A0A071M3Q5_9BURK|nr:porin [Burkholderia seminalis]AOJ28631.1 porin [Burkholderia seminalis]KVF52662.1 porin [Burkholderia seminalis]MCA8040357.1 porin [Burkholderia seminalis]MCA8302091.1 porin [Burkholderia seminalis]MCA8423612.1 porin [Burkholderia seminalis]
MTKRIILTSALTLCATPVLAQSSITLYGRIDTSIEYSNFGPNHAVHMGSGDIAATSWGLKGVEDLGGGLRAIFKLENGFNSFNGVGGQNGALFGRESWVGLAGSFGAFQAGVNYTPIHTILVTYSLPAYGAGLGWGNAADNFVYGPSLRVSNSLRYVSPRIGGFVVRALVARGNNGASNGAPASLGDTYSGGVNYVYNNLSVDIGYQLQRFSPVKTLTASSPVEGGNYALAGVSYNFGFVKPAFVYVRHRGGQDVPNMAGSTYANPHSDFFEASAEVPISIGKLLLSYGHYRKIANSDGNADSFGIRYDYPLSKRTIVYAGAAEVRNGDAAAFSLNNAGGPAALAAPKPGQNSNSVVIGMLHLF